MNDINGNPLTEEWMAEFRGFFFGSGSIMISRCGTNYRPMVEIDVREDDKGIVEDFHAKLGGGGVNYKKGRVVKGTEYRSRPQVAWYVTKKDDLMRICNILDMGHLPSRKRMAIAIMREFLDTIDEIDKRLDDDILAIREGLAMKLRNINTYRGEMVEQAA